ncbi:glycosyltransferase [Candidatus Woesearchaeota archaeon]|nr:glycosyltransferase [Candidatus Woesearchaeota archaeon]
MNPKISIIIPAYNEEKYIRQTLHSLKVQTFQDFEVIVVANGCTDKTEELVRKRFSQKVKLFSLSEPHVSRARNYGAEKAQGEFLLFLDADTILDATSLQKINQSFHHQQAIATTKVKPDDSKMKFKVSMMFKNFYNKTGLYKGCGGVLICRKEHFFKVQGYDDLVVKEHKKLTDKLLQYGSYMVIDTYATTSMRRLQNWGLLKSTFFWTRKWLQDKVGDLRKSEYEMVR